MQEMFRRILWRIDKSLLKRSIAVWLAILTTAAEASGGAPASRPINLIANEWQPYTGSGLAQQGVAAQIVRTALNRAGYAVTIRFSNWPRALHTTYQGNADGVVAVYATTARAQRLLFSEKYLDSRIAAVAMNRNFIGSRKLSELRGMKIGIGRDYDYSDEFLREPGLSMQPVDHAIQNLLKLTIRRIDVAIEDRLIIQHNIQHNIATHPELGSIISSKEDLLVLPIHMGINKSIKDADLIVRNFNSALGAMKQDGSLRKILSEWRIPPI